MKNGILPIQELKKAVAKGWIEAPPLAAGQLQPASLDLRLGPKAYRIRCSFLPQKRTVEEMLPELSMYEVDLTKSGILERGSVYLIPLMEQLALPKHIRGRTNPKSSTGRLDIFTRVITDDSHRFEEIRAGYKGQLYLEVAPLSFTVRVTPGLCLNQLRLFTGDIRIGDEELTALYNKNQLLYDEYGGAVPLRGETQTKKSKATQPKLFMHPVSTEQAVIRDGLFMSIDLKGEAGNPIIGYKARSNSAIVDLTKVAGHAVDDYWEPIHARNGSLILEPDEFYIFASRERVRVPPTMAAEMVEYDAGTGELRTHYAGFFDSGFGYGNDDLRGTRAVLEARPRDVPFRIEHGQVLFKLVYERMLKMPTTSYGDGSNYQHQGLTLSKHFKAPEAIA